jgi:hypothetical protein
MIIPGMGEGTNIINVHFCISGIPEDVFRYFLSKHLLLTLLLRWP